jgi:hypothetical protein
MKERMTESMHVQIETQQIQKLTLPYVLPSYIISYMILYNRSYIISYMLPQFRAYTWTFLTKLVTCISYTRTFQRRSENIYKLII